MHIIKVSKRLWAESFTSSLYESCKKMVLVEFKIHLQFMQLIDLDMIHPFESKRGMTSIAVERLEFNVMMLKAIKTSLLNLCVR